MFRIGVIFNSESSQDLINIIIKNTSSEPQNSPLSTPVHYVENYKPDSDEGGDTEGGKNDEDKNRGIICNLNEILGLD